MLVAGAVFYGSPRVKKGKTYLQKNQRVGAIVPPPNNPQNIAQKKKPERPIPFELSL